MFKILDKKEKMSFIEAGSKYPKYGFIMTDIKDKRALDGGLLPCEGILHAICDDDDSNKLYDEANRLKEDGIRVLIDMTNIASPDGIWEEDDG